MADYQVWLCDPFGSRLELLREWSRLEYTRVLCNVGQFYLESTAWPSVPLRRDMRLAVYRDGLLENVYLLTYARRHHLYGTIVMKGVCPNHLLKRRVVAYHKGTSQGTKAAKRADTAMYEIVNENLGGGAGTRSLGSYLDVIPALDVGPTISATVAWKNVLDALREIFEMTVKAGSPQFFNVWAPSETRFVFEVRPTLWGRDRTLSTTEQVVFSPMLGTATNIEDEVDWTDEITVAYVMGGGQDNPTVSEVTNADVLDEGPFTRIEEVVNASSESDSTSLEDAGKAKLAEKRRVLRQYADILSTSEAPYRKAWDLGDAISIVSEYMKFDAIVEAVHIKVAEKEEIKPKLVHYG